MEVFPTVGLQGETVRQVTATDTAAVVGSGDQPVLATPTLLAWVENAAFAAVSSQLPDGMTTVGTRLDFRHLAATPVGMKVTACATLQEIDGRRLTFWVEARDERERIGDGRHERYIVPAEKFLAKAKMKIVAE
ncbi:MAG: thioesterase family protein [bacterium]|jgi:fluoroacetyl-CoA thioesterase